MALIILNAADAAFPAQAEPDQLDFATLVAGFQQIGVRHGCAVTTTGAANGSVTVSAGMLTFGTVYRKNNGTTIAIPANSSGNPRFDIISSSNASPSVSTRTQGTAAASPAFPAIPAGHALLAAIYVPNGHTGTTTIPANTITDKRCILRAAPPYQFNFIDYGAFGDSNHGTAPGGGGGTDDYTAMQNCVADAQQARMAAYINSGFTFGTTQTLDLIPDTTKKGCGLLGIGGASNGAGTLWPTIAWIGADGGGPVVAIRGTGQNIPGVPLRDFRVAGRGLAMDGIHWGPHSTTPTASAKLDSGSEEINIQVTGCKRYGTRYDSGFTNFQKIGGRYDAIGEYAIYMKNYTGSRISIRDITYDNNLDYSGYIPKGFLHVDGAGQPVNSSVIVRLDRINIETQIDWAEVNAGGTDPADRRGVVHVTIEPTVGSQSVHFAVDAFEVSGASARASYAFFLPLGGTTDENRGRFNLVGKVFNGLTGNGTAATGHKILIGNIPPSYKNTNTGGGLGAVVEFYPGGGGIFTNNEPWRFTHEGP